jgi:hypothetical protein
VRLVAAHGRRLAGLLLLLLLLVLLLLLLLSRGQGGPFLGASPAAGHGELGDERNKARQPP